MNKIVTFKLINITIFFLLRIQLKYVLFYLVYDILLIILRPSMEMGTYISRITL